MAMSVFLFTEACHADPSNAGQSLTLLSLANLIAAPSIIPLAILYFNMIKERGYSPHLLSMSWLVVPAILFTASMVLYLVIGPAEIDSFTNDVYARGHAAVDASRGTIKYVYFIVTVVVFQAILAFEVLMFIFFLISFGIKERFNFRDLAAFVTKGGSVKVTFIQSFISVPILLLLLVNIMDFSVDLSHDKVIGSIVALLLSVFMALFDFIALFSAKKMVTRREIRNVARYNYGSADKSAIVEEMMNDLLDEAETEALERVQEKIGKNLHIEEFKSDVPSPERSAVASRIFDAVTDSWEEEDILGRFQGLMRDELLFLKPGLSLEDVADRLDTNKFYVSKMVNNTFNIGFPEVINILRVDYAKQFILKHPDAKQTEIATKCGFFSASTFNTIFKKVTGMTPRMWVASRELS